jgi:hypothetical protein
LSLELEEEQQIKIEDLIRRAQTPFNQTLTLNENLNDLIGAPKCKFVNPNDVGDGLINSTISSIPEFELDI